jgi:protein SCO1/2
MRARALIWGGLSGVIVLVAAMSVWTLVSSPLRPGPAGPGVAGALESPGDYGAVPPFTLTERTGASVSLGDLRGSWWVADFIFTRCGSICPMLSTQMARLVASVPDLERGDVRFVSITVDPAHDTPEILADYARRYVPPQAERLWMFLTGSRDEIHALVGDGLHLSVIERSEEEVPAGELITHTERFVLIDPEGRIRGYYHGTEEDSVRRLAADLDRLRDGA